MSQGQQHFAQPCVGSVFGGADPGHDMTFWLWESQWHGSIIIIINFIKKTPNSFIRFAEK